MRTTPMFIKGIDGAVGALEIRYMLEAKGYSLSRLARELGYSVTLVSFVVAGKRYNRRIRDRIGEVVGCPVSELWPEGQEGDDGR